VAQAAVESFYREYAKNAAAPDLVKLGDPP
jgi:hypothetical protein